MLFTLNSALKFIVFLSFFLVCNKFFAQQDSTKFVRVADIQIIGNKTTKKHIIERELTFDVGDTIFNYSLNETLERTKSNLIITSLFNFVTIDVAYIDELHVSLIITVEERWYWWPLPIFEIQETNFNTWWLDKDLERVNYGFSVVKENFRGRKEVLNLKFQQGYTEKIGLKYSVPYVNKKQTQGLSFNINYSRNHEVNYGTVDNKRLFYKEDDSYVRTEFFSGVAFSLRPKLYNVHSFQFMYSNLQLADSVLFYNNNWLSEGNTNTQYFSASYYLKRDKRNNKFYPTMGNYFDFQITQNGLQVFDEKINTTFLVASYRKYLKLTDKLYFAINARAKATFNELPYALTSGLGYSRNTVRGYEYYVVNGAHYGLLKSQLRFGIIEDKIFKMGIIPLNKFNKIPISVYLGAFWDNGYVSENLQDVPNFLNNRWLSGSGVSLDFVSYYDMVFRLEYSINRFNEHGLFIHFISPL